MHPISDESFIFLRNTYKSRNNTDTKITNIVSQEVIRIDMHFSSFEQVQIM